MALMRALAMVGENLDDAAFAHAPMAALVDHPSKLVAQGAELGDLALDRGHMATSDLIGAGA